MVGITDYLRVEDVPYAERDAQTFSAFVRQTLGIPGSRVFSPLTRNKEAIEKAVAEAGRAVSAGGTVWVYFAGHGAAHPETKERLLLGDDVPPEGSFASRAVSVSALEKLAGVGGGRVVVIADVCYTGQFRSLVLDPPAPTGQVIEWSATQKGQVAAPLTGTDHGAFTYLLLGAFRGWADGEPAVDGAQRDPPDGIVTAREARDYVQRGLAALQMRDQVPTMSLSGEPLESELVRGVNEPPPTLASTEYEAKLAALRQAQDVAARAGADVETAKRAHDDRVAAEVEAKAAEATRAWAAARPLLAKGGEDGQLAAQLYVDTYSDATVDVDGTVVPVDIREVADARAALERIEAGKKQAESARAKRAAADAAKAKTAADKAAVAAGQAATRAARGETRAADDSSGARRDAGIAAPGSQDAKVVSSGRGSALGWHAFVLGGATGATGLAEFVGFGGGAGAGLDLAVTGTFQLWTEVQYAGGWAGEGNEDAVWLTGGPAVRVHSVLVGVGPSWSVFFGDLGAGAGTAGVGGATLRAAYILTRAPELKLRVSGGAWTPANGTWTWSAGIGVEVGSYVER